MFAPPNAGKFRAEPNVRVYCWGQQQYKLCWACCCSAFPEFDLTRGVAATYSSSAHLKIGAPHWPVDVIRRHRRTTSDPLFSKKLLDGVLEVSSTIVLLAPNFREKVRPNTLPNLIFACILGINYFLAPRNNRCGTVSAESGRPAQQQLGRPYQKWIMYMMHTHMLSFILHRRLPSFCSAKQAGPVTQDAAALGGKRRPGCCFVAVPCIGHR